MMSTFERRREFGMLLALGSRPARLVRMILVEAVLLGILGVLVGTACGVLFVFATSGGGIDMASWGGNGEFGEMAYKGLNLPVLVHPRLELRDPLIGFAAVLATSLIASVWPTIFAARLEPVKAMHQ
jgi:ABC-type antimicrobial peptide transport system permease subunit